jgi:CBS domain-containing protein
MTKDVVKVDPELSLSKAKSLFSKKKIRHAPVVKEGRLVGIVSLTDIQRMSFGETFGDDELDADIALSDMLSVGQIMRTNPVTVEPQASIKSIAKVLTNAEFHALPVVKDDQLLGIVTTTDVIKALLKFCE